MCAKSVETKLQFFCSEQSKSFQWTTDCAQAFHQLMTSFPPDITVT